MKKTLMFFAALFLLGCSDESPLRYFLDPTDDFTGGYSDTYVIYDDEIKTKGGVQLIPEAENQTFDAASNERFNGRKAIRYSWNGGAVRDLGTPQNGFAGFQLIVDLAALDTATPPLDFTAAGYTKVTFYAKTDLAPGVRVKVEGPDDGNKLTAAPRINILTSSDWTHYEIASAAFGTVEQYLNVTFENTLAPAQSGGGTVWVDDVRFEK